MDELMNTMLNYAFEHSIGFQLVKLKPHTPSLSTTSSRYIIINTNWWRKNEIPFIVAHEIAHILNGDADINYYGQSCSIKTKREQKADIRAITIIILLYFRINYDYALDDVIPIMNQLCIPLKYLKETKSIVRQYIWYGDNKRND